MTSPVTPRLAPAPQTITSSSDVPPQGRSYAVPAATDVRRKSLRANVLVARVQTTDLTSTKDCGDELAAKCESGGSVATILTIPFRMLWSVTKIAGNGVGALFACATAAVTTTSATVVCLTAGSCSSDARGVSRNCCLLAADNVRYSVIAIGSVGAKVITGPGFYLGKLCCEKDIADYEKHTFRYIGDHCIKGSCSSAPEGVRKDVQGSCYTQAIRTLTGASRFGENIIKFTPRAAGSVVFTPEQITAINNANSTVSTQ